MALEAANYINQLIETNPNGTDIKGQGDDHIRMIKKAIKQTFPNISGPVTVNQNQLNLLTSTDLFVKPGMVMMWSGDVSNIPSGWLLCNGVGTLSNGYPVPQMLDRFIVAAGSGYGQRQTGGSSSHTHSGEVGYHVLTEAEMPAHNHNVDGRDQFVIAQNGTGGISNGFSGGMGFHNPIPKGGNNGHNHPLSIGWVDHRPDYFAILFIVKY
jgi:hypothetical protein